MPIYKRADDACTWKACTIAMEHNPIDYPEAPTEKNREMREMIASAESNAPPAMLRSQREWDRRTE